MHGRPALFHDNRFHILFVCLFQMYFQKWRQKSLNVSCPTNIKFCYSLFLVSQQQGRGMYKDLDSGYHYEGNVNHKK